MPGWMKHKLESRWLGEMLITSDMQKIIPLWQRQKGTKEPLDESWREWKSWLKAQHSENLNHGIQSYHFMANRWEISGRLYFWGSKITADGDCSHEIKRRLFLGRKSYLQPRQHIKNQRGYFADRGLSSQSYGFSSSHVWMWELDYKESWALK